MRKIYLLLFLILTANYAQKDLRFEFDYSQFKFDSTSNYLEIYYSFVPSDFTLIEESSKFSIKGKMVIQIQKNETQELVVNKEWGLNQTFKDRADYNNGKSLLGAVGFNLLKGSYSLDISIEDNSEPSNSKSYSEKIEIKPFLRKSFSVSDIEFATRILNDNVNENSIFYKNTLEVYPNPAVVYTDKSPVMFYYSELYDLNKTKSGEITLMKTLFNSSNTKVFENAKPISTLKESIVEVGLVNLKKYPTDTYTFVLTLIDEKNNEYTSSSKRFYLLNPSVKIAESSNIANASFMSSEFSILSNEECDNLFDKSKLIASKEEIDQFSVIDSLNNKREFLYKFWKKRDTTPETPAIEFKTNFLQRVDIANKRYRTMTTAGFKTDRGRIFLRLGEPDEIERHPNETNVKPYEIWYYHQIEGGVYFVFGDYTGFNFYELLHSSMRGELQDPNWAYRLQTK